MFRLRGRDERLPYPFNHFPLPLLFMKSTLLLYLMLVWASLSYGQGRFKLAPDSLCANQMRVFAVFSQDTIVVSCDTMYLVNKVAVHNYRAFRRYAQKTERGKIFEALNELYERRMAEQKAEYDSLMGIVQRFQSQSESTMGEIEGRADSMNFHLAQIDSSLVQATLTLAEVRDSVKREKRSAWWKKAGVGLGGVAIGLLLGLLIGQNGG
jgi:hypothetical protein